MRFCDECGIGVEGPAPLNVVYSRYLDFRLLRFRIHSRTLNFLGSVHVCSSIRVSALQTFD